MHILASSCRGGGGQQKENSHTALSKHKQACVASYLRFFFNSRIFHTAGINLRFDEIFAT